MRAEQRRRLLVVLAVVDVIALMTVAVLVLRRVEATRPVVLPAPTSASATAPSASGTAGEVLRFALPSRNITCALSSAGATCVISQIDAAPTPTPTCTGSVGHQAVLDATGLHTPCTTGSPTPDPDGLVLPYGASQTVGDYTCTSATTGVTCTSKGGAGFRLARSGLTALP